MNFRFISNQIGMLLVVLSAILLGVALWEAFDWLLWDAEPEATGALLATAGVGFLFGGVLWLLGRGHDQDTFGRREALILVSASWLLGAALSALPYLLWANFTEDLAAAHPFHRYVNCYFEAMSGLTTTGATVLIDVDAVPRGLLLWRSLTHWLGGLGIVVLFVAVLPTLGVGGKKIFHVEAPGPRSAGVRPRIRETARTLWLIYTGMTLAMIAALWLCGLSLFDSVCHTFGTVATGGFSSHTASVGHYNATAVNLIVIVFMILAGVNFGLYFRLLRGSVRNIWKDPELRFYLAIMAIGSLVIVGSIALSGEPIALTNGEKVDSSIGNALEQGAFTAVSIQTTTGFGTADFNLWPFLAKAVLVFMMFVGGCAGSTGGGIKVVRVWIAMKIVYAELEKAFRPNVVRATRLGSGSVDADLKLAVLVYVLGTVGLAGLGAVLVKSFEGPDCDIITAATASIASLFSIGPGLGKVGAVMHYGWMTDASKILLSIWMLLGRLEVFPIFVLFVPRFWMRD